MKHFLIACFAFTATYTQAQYFQTYYGSNDPIEFLTCGHNAYQGGPASTGHFMVGASPWTATNHFPIAIKVQRTDINGSCTGGAPYFNNEYFLTDIINPPAMPLNLGVQNPQSLEFSAGGGGDFAVVGSYINGGAGSGPGLGVFYLQLGPGGNIINTTGYYIGTGNFNDIVVTAISESIQTPGDFYVCGYLVENTGTAQKRIFVLRIAKNGALVWSHMYRLNWNTNSDTDIPHDIIESPVQNGGSNAHEVIVVGEHSENGAAIWPDAFLLRIDDASGNMINPVRFYGSINSHDVFTCIKPSNNTVIDANQAGYIIGGYSDYAGTYDFWQIALSQAWNIAWSNLYNYNKQAGPTSNKDFCNDVMERLNTNNAYEYYMAGYTDDGVFGTEDVMVVKTDQNGNWVTGGQFTYGDTDADRGISIDQLNGFGSNTDGISVSCYSWPTTAGLGGFDHYLVKAYFNGVTTCQDDQIDPDPHTGPGLISTESSDNYNGNTFYDYPLLTVFQQPLSESNRCNSASETDGDNTRQQPKLQPAPGFNNAASVSVFPNPLQASSGKVDLQLNASATATAEVSVADMLGRVYYAQQANLTRGSNTLTLQIPGMQQGLYFLRVKTQLTQYKTLLQVK